jgi:hypothetical protein
MKQPREAEFRFQSSQGSSTKTNKAKGKTDRKKAVDFGVPLHRIDVLSGVINDLMRTILTTRVVKQHRYVAGICIGRGQVGHPIAVEVPHRHELRGLANSKISARV